MRTTFLFAAIVFIASGCQKDKYTTAPQITYESISPNAIDANNANQQANPILTIGITDAEGDFGFVDQQDTSYVYVKNLLTGKFDSAFFPAAVNNFTGKDFHAEVKIDLYQFLETSNRPSPKIDTTYFEVYVTDFAKNKSNVLVTPEPVYIISQ